MEASHQDHANKFFTCECNICQAQLNMPQKDDIDRIERDVIANYEGIEKSYTWILQMLGECSQQSVVKINIPETVVFKKGRVAFYLQQTRERVLKYYTQGDKLKLVTIRKNITNIAHQRKRDDVSLRKPGDMMNYGREVAVLRYMVRDKENVNCEAKDEEGAIQILPENEFLDLISQRINSPIWRSISYLQPVLKCKTGFGQTIQMTYYSHDADDREAIEKLQLSHEVESDQKEEQLAIENIHEYCQLMCRRIAFFLAANQHFELLRMRAEFMIDDTGKVWFVFADKISIREIRIKNLDDHIQFRRIQLIDEQKRVQVHQQLDSSQTEATSAQKIAEKMQEHYQYIKQSLGIDEAFAPPPLDHISNAAFAQLRPTTPYTLHELLDRKMMEKLEDRHFPPREVKKRPEMLVTGFTNDIRPTDTTNTSSWVYTPRLKFGSPSSQRGHNNSSREISRMYSSRTLYNKYQENGRNFTH